MGTDPAELRAPVQRDLQDTQVPQGLLRQPHRVKMVIPSTCKAPRHPLKARPASALPQAGSALRVTSELLGCLDWAVLTPSHLRAPGPS